MTGQVEQTKDIGTDAKASVTRWLRELDLSSSHEAKWRERAEKIVKRYRDEDRQTDAELEQNQKSRFNILFANTEVLKGVMYQRCPVPDVRRRFLTKDPIGRQTAQILQRGLSFSVDSYDFDGLMESCVEDTLLPGRGMARVKYEAMYGSEPIEQPAEGAQPVYPVVDESVECEYVEWEMFRMSPAKRWSKVRWVAFGELLTRDELVKYFKEKGKACTLDWAPKDKENEKDDLFKRALVWQIWDKTSKKVIYVSKGYTEGPLNEIDDPLGLEQFFPCPKPVYSCWTTNSLVPVPEYVQYQDQAIELDLVSERIDHLISGLRRRGVYDSTFAELEKLKDAGDNEFIPIENWAKFMEGKGIADHLFEEPIEVIAKVLTGLYTQRDQIKNVIYEITGIADIVRGSTKSDETLGAQELKARYANVRVAPRQKRIAMFARDLLRLKAELIANKFSPDTLKMMTGPELWQVQGRDATQQIMDLMRNDRLRGFRVDIETDSTVQPDASEEQKNRTELLAGISSFITAIGPAVQTGQIPKQFAVELLSFGVRGFKVSPQIEEALDMLADQTQGQPQQNPDVMRLTQENEQLRAAADETTVKREELQARREETAFKREQVGAQRQQAQMDQQAMMSEREMQMNQAVEARYMPAMQQMGEMMQQMMGQVAQALQGLAQGQQQLGQMLQQMQADSAGRMDQMHATMRAPRQKQIVRGPDGRAQSVVERVM